MERKEKPKAELRNWEYNAYSSTYMGDVFGHPNFENGTRVRTTKAKYFEHKENEIETLNTIYVLGERKCQ